MPATLITFLGKTDNYATIPYQFADGTPSEEDSNFHLALRAHLSPDKTVLLGTPSSTWDSLFELEGDTPDEYRDTRNHLQHKVKVNEECPIEQEQDLTQTAEWQALASFLATTYPGTEIGIIPYGQSEQEQIDILQKVSEFVAVGDTLYLDITHGFRHLPMLVVLVALYLQRTKNVTIKGVYYGASELWGKDGSDYAPVLDLQGLLRIAEWVSGLDQFGKDGDYSVFSGLLGKDNFPHTKELGKAAFFERNFNVSSAKQELSTVYPQLDHLTGLSALFQNSLQDALAWHRKGSENPYARQRDRAEFFLQNRDYIRAVLFAFEAYITYNMQGDFTDYKARDAARSSLSGGDFHTLRILRNILAHGSFKSEVEYKKERDTLETVKSWLKDENKLRENLTSLLNRLFK